MKNNEKYYIGGKQYVPAESFLLCKTVCGSLMNIDGMISTCLFMTKNKTFFIVKEDITGTEVHVVEKDKAFAFMDENAAGIDIEIYDMLFGEPEKG